MNNPRFSIIIPHYNIPTLLCRCLDSIPMCEDIQVIVVDDCSPEDCKSILRQDVAKKYPWVTFVFMEANGGGGRARNEGLKYAKGKWLLFADADDFFSENVSFLLNKYKDTDADIVYFGVDNVSSENPAVKMSQRLVNAEKVRAYLSNGDESVLRYMFTEPWSKMIRKELVDDNGIRFSETKVCNDYFFSAVTGYHAKKIAADQSVLYVVTQRESSVSSRTETSAKMLDRINVTTSVLSYLRSQRLNLPEKYYVEKIDMLMISLLKTDLWTGLKQFIVIERSGLSVLPILGRMLRTFVSNRFK